MRCSGDGNRGITRAGPSHSPSRAAAASTAAATLAPGVLEQVHHDLAVGALGPAADHAPVAPHRGPGVAVRVEELRPVVAEVPVPFLPAHDRRVERGKERDPGPGGPARRRGRRRGRVRSCRRRARPPPASTSTSARSTSRLPRPVHHCRSVRVPGPKARSQRRTSSTRAASAGIVAIGAPSHDSVGTHEYWLLTHVPRGRPRTTVPAVAEDREDPGRDPDGARPRLPFAVADLGVEPGHRLRQLTRARLAPALQLAHRGPLHLPGPRRTVVDDAALLDQLHEEPALVALERRGDRGVHHRDEVEGHDPHRAPHPEHADERTVVVERLLHRRDRPAPSCAAPPTGGRSWDRWRAARPGRAPRSPGRERAPSARGDGGVPAAPAAARR